MKATTHFEVIIEVHFTDAEIELITKCLLDSEYKSEVASPEGFWNIYMRVRKFFKEKGTDFYRPLTFRQIDKIIKTFEPYTNDWLKNDLVLKLNKDLRFLLESVNSLSSFNKRNKIIFK